MVWNGGKPDAYNHPKNIKPNDNKNTGEVISIRPSWIIATISVTLTVPVMANKNPIPKSIIGLPIEPRIMYFKAIS